MLVCSEDALKFAHEFGGVLAMPIMLEAVMRVRASRGEFITTMSYKRHLTPHRYSDASFHGNFFVRSTDLLAMPAVPQDPVICHRDPDRGNCYVSFRCIANRRAAYHMLWLVPQLL